MTDNDNTDDLLASRQEVYGDRIDNMVRTAQMWSGFLGHEIQAWQVPIMMALYKTYRMANAPDYSDNIDDVEGWLRMYREVMGDDLIQARTVEEYLEKKGRAHEQTPVANLTAAADHNPTDIAEWYRNRCAAETGEGPCIFVHGHDGYCVGARHADGS